MPAQYQYFDYVKLQTGNEKSCFERSVSRDAKKGLKQVAAANIMHFYIATSLWCVT